MFQCIHHITSIHPRQCKHSVSVCSAVAKYQVVVKVVKVAGYTHTPPLIIMGKFPSTDQTKEGREGKGKKRKRWRWKQNQTDQPVDLMPDCCRRCCSLSLLYFIFGGKQDSPLPPLTRQSSILCLESSSSQRSKLN